MTTGEGRCLDHAEDSSCSAVLKSSPYYRHSRPLHDMYIRHHKSADTDTFRQYSHRGYTDPVGAEYVS